MFFADWGIVFLINTVTMKVTFHKMKRLIQVIHKIKLGLIFYK